MKLSDIISENKLPKLPKLAPEQRSKVEAEWLIKFKDVFDGIDPHDEEKMQVAFWHGVVEPGWNPPSIDKVLTDFMDAGGDPSLFDDKYTIPIQVKLLKKNFGLSQDEAEDVIS